MDSPQRLARHEPFERFQPQSEFSNRQRPLSRQTPCPKPGQLVRRRVFRAVDDPQVFPTSAFQRGLHQPLRSACNEIERLHDHTLAAPAGELFPPAASLRYGSFIGE
jgi:hypothetical protein